MQSISILTAILGAACSHAFPVEESQPLSAEPLALTEGADNDVASSSNDEAIIPAELPTLSEEQKEEAANFVGWFLFWCIVISAGFVILYQIGFCDKLSKASQEPCKPEAEENEDE